MGRIARILPWVLTMAVVATAASAQTSPTVHSRHHRTLDNAYVPAPPDRTAIESCCVLGPAYGRPGEPLGPGIWGLTGVINPRSCGPGLCQNDSHY
jgi:hypothetical protein